MCDEEFDEMEDLLIYNEDTEDIWGGIFNIATPQEIADEFGLPVLVKSTGKIYKKGEKKWLEDIN